jgi:hypothetical protein
VHAGRFLIPESIDHMSNTKHRKRQDDRLLKRLSRQERRQQEELRRQIMSDPLFKLV